MAAQRTSSLSKQDDETLSVDSLPQIPHKDLRCDSSMLQDSTSSSVATVMVTGTLRDWIANKKSYKVSCRSCKMLRNVRLYKCSSEEPSGKEWRDKQSSSWEVGNSRWSCQLKENHDIQVSSDGLIHINQLRDVIEDASKRRTRKVSNPLALMLNPTLKRLIIWWWLMVINLRNFSNLMRKETPSHYSLKSFYMSII